MSINPEEMKQQNVIPSGKRIRPTCPNCNVLLVDDKCPKCDYVRVKGYDIEPDTDMTGHGFRKALTFKYLHVDREKNIITVYEVDHYVKDFVCASCETDRFTWLCPQRTGVYKTCLRCHKTTGPISQENGILRKTYQISPKEALQILEARSVPESMLKPVKDMIYTKKYVEPRKRPKTVR